MNEFYKKYLRTEHWKEFRKEYLELNPFCERCGRDAITVHHLNYDCLFNETDADVEALCSDCHKEEHEAEIDINN